MKKTNLYIIVAAVVVVGLGLWLWLGRAKACADMNETECRTSGRCTSVLVPNNCANPPCVPEVIFQECKDRD